MGCMVNSSIKKNTSESACDLSLASGPKITVAGHYPRMYRYKIGFSLSTIREVTPSLELSVSLDN